MKTILLVALLFVSSFAVGQPTFTFNKVYFNKQHTNKVSVSNTGQHAYVVKGKDKREVGQVDAAGREQDISSFFTSFTDKAFNDIQSTDSNYVFVATNGDFLLRFDGTATKHLKEQHGLQGGIVTSLAGRRTLYLGTNVKLFHSINGGLTQFALTFSLNNPTIGMSRTQEAMVFTVDRGLNFQFQHPPVNHWCNYTARFTQFIIPANLHYRSYSFGQGKPDTSHVYTAHHVIPYKYDGYAHYDTYNYMGTRTGLRKALAHSCEAKVYLPRRKVYKLLEVRTYPYETFGSPALEQRYLLSATDSGLYVNKILSDDRAIDTFELVAGTSHLQIFDIDTDECYSKLWLATDQGLYSFSINHQLEEIKPQLSHNGIQNVCFSPSFRITTTVAKGYTTQWLKDGIPIPNATNTYYDATEPGTYHALLKSDCYDTSITTAEVTLRKSVLLETPITAEGNLVKCPDEVVRLSTVLREDYTYQWFRDGEPIENSSATSTIFTTTEAGAYKVLATNCYNNAVFSKTIVIKNNDLPDPIISFTTNRVCAGESVELTVPDYVGKIDWFLNDKPISADAQQPNKLTATLERSGSSYQEYTVRFTNEFGCTSMSEPVPVYFFAPPIVNISKEPAGTICIGAPQRLKVQTNIWDFNVSWSTGSTSNSISVSEPGDYSVTVTNRNSGCSTTETIKVNFHSLPVLTVPTDTTVCEASLGSLLLNAGPPDMTYTLNGTPQHSNILTITRAGSYTLTGTDKYGCTSTSSVNVQNFCDDFIIPNIITPNGDNLNDWFVIQNLVPNCELKIFNRSGALVYQNRNYQNNWQGDKLSNGIYYYILNSTSLNKTWKGWVEIVN